MASEPPLCVDFPAMRRELQQLLTDPDRLRALADTHLLDTEVDGRFDKFPRLTAALLRTQSSAFSLLDADREYFKSAVALAEPWWSLGQAPLSHSFSQHVLAHDAPWSVDDVLTDSLLRDHPTVVDSVRAYAAAPLRYDGAIVGVLSVFDPNPRKWSRDELAALEALADALTTEIELRATQGKLAARLQLVNALSDSALDAILSIDARGLIVFANRAAELMFDRAERELIGHPATELMPPRFREAHVQALEQLNTGGRPHVLGRVLQFPALRNDEEFTVELSLSQCGGTSGPVYTAILRDVTARAELERSLRSAEQQLRLTIDRAPIGMALVSPEGRWLSVNDALCALIGYSREELLRSDFQTITHPDDLRADLDLVNKLLAGECQSYQLEKRYIHREGHSVWVLLSVSLVRDDNGAPSFFISQVQDISERRELERQIREASLRDELTGLQNRRGFMFLAEQQLNAAARYGRDHVLLFADLNGLKAVNDRLGHAEGDRMIVAMAGVLRRTFRRADLLARFGGDEFVLLAEGGENFTSIAERKLQEAIDEHNTATDAFQLSASVGTAVWSAAQRPPLSELLCVADDRMYVSKRAHHSRRSGGSDDRSL